MPPIGEAKAGTLGVVLVKEMIFSAPMDNAVGVVHPARGRNKMVDRPVEILRQVTTLLGKIVIRCRHYESSMLLLWESRMLVLPNYTENGMLRSI